MLPRWTFALLAGTALFTAPAVATAGPCYEDADPGEVTALLAATTDGEPLILDVRTPGEFYSRGGHIEGAILLPVSELSSRLEELSHLKDQEIIVVCRSGNRSAVAARTLCDHGFTNVTNLAGGMNSWARAGQPITTSR